MRSLDGLLLRYDGSSPGRRGQAFGRIADVVERHVGGDDVRHTGLVVHAAAEPCETIRASLERAFAQQAVDANP